MTTSKIEQDIFFEIDTDFYHDQITRIVDYFGPQFSRMIKRYVIFNVIFLLLIALETVFMFACFSRFSESYLCSFSITLLFLTTFCFFTCRSYLQARKPEQLREFKNRFVKSCKHLINYREGVPEHHLALANACCRFDTLMRGKEYRYYAPPRFLNFLAPKLEKLSCRCHWNDIHLMREELLKTSVEEHIKLVKCEPTNLEVHASLANAYVMLSGLYLDPKKHEGYDDDKWIPPLYETKEMRQKFRKTAEKAIEEFKILLNFAPNDLWVHSQLAYSYHDLNMPLEEIKEYEAILQLCPGDKDTLYKLGVLYFEQGMNAKGLQVYEDLKKSHYLKAETLIQSYC